MLIIAGLAFGLVYLLTWDIAPPSVTIEHTLPDERFPK